jgi:hypothetical protein
MIIVSDERLRKAPPLSYHAIVPLKDRVVAAFEAPDASEPTVACHGVERVWVDWHKCGARLLCVSAGGG